MNTVVFKWHFSMATQNGYNLMWMNPNEMMMGEGVSMSAPVPSDMMTLDQTPQLDNTFYSMAAPPPYESVQQQQMELDGFLMMDELEGDYGDEPPRYMAAATQTNRNLRRKIMPIKEHSGLKLKTPIAFQCGSDLNVIPIEKDGMAVCVKCGAIGVKHAFYTRNRNYCSLSCARGDSSPRTLGESQNIKEEREETDGPINTDILKFKMPNDIDIKDEDMITKDVLKLPNIGSEFMLPSFNVNPHMGVFGCQLKIVEDTVPEAVTDAKVKQELSLSYDWEQKFDEPSFVAASVNYFKHAPMADYWEDITVGMKVEVENSDWNNDLVGGMDSFWVATVIRLEGYKALLRYEGFDETRDFWVNICCSNVHHVGWCALRGKPLIPPKSISENCKDWKAFLVHRLTDARTLPTNFAIRVTESLKSRFRVGMQLEVIDREKICQMCVATIKRIVGKRLHMAYYNADADDSGFWCHEDSPLIHPVGWSLRVGHKIDALHSYLTRCESGVPDKDDTSEELFTAPFQSINEWKPAEPFRKGMKLEAIDPLNLGAICAATVMKVLKDGYLMIRIDSYSENAGDGSDWFCYHSASPCIFPAGFCHRNGIPLVPPINFAAETFSWEMLAMQTGCVLAHDDLFKREEIEHGYKIGMHLECADIMDPRLVCVATVTRVIGRLLKIHFNGWEDDFDQWMDCRSPDIYPVGWCSLVSHKLEAPKNELKPFEAAEKKKNRSKKTKRKQGKVKGPVNKKPLQEKEDGEVMSVESQSQIPECARSTAEAETHVSEAQHTASEPPNIISGDSTSTPHTPLTEKYIPRLADGLKDGNLNPDEWNSEDVATFLRSNDCGVYADNFITEGTTGVNLLKMTQDEIMKVTGKMGPALKIYALVQNLNHHLKLKASKFGRR